MNKIERHVCMLPKVPKCTELPPTAGFFRRFVCGIIDAMGPCAWHHGSALYIRSERRLRLERARGRGRCHPYSACAAYWQATHMLLTVLNYVYMPFQVFFVNPNPYDPFILFCDCASFVNICLTFNTGYVDEDSKQIVLEAKAIALHYLRSTFLPDLLAALPLQLIYPFADWSRPYNTNTTMYIFKLFGLVTLKKEWTCMLEQAGLSYVKKQLSIVASCVLLFFHWMTFINYQVILLSLHYHSENKRVKVWDNFFKVSSNEEWDSVFHKYTANLFLVCGLCIGAGYFSGHDDPIESELLLTSTLGVLGLVFMIYFFSILLRLAIYGQMNVNIFNGRLNELNKYMVFKRLPQFLQRKIHLFINYKFNGQYYNEQSILSTINEQIKQDINMFSCQAAVAHVPLFQDLPVALINAITFSLTLVLYMPGEVLVRCNQPVGLCVQVLVRCNQPGSSLFMISSGTVAVMSSSGREVSHLRDGSYFGETALIRPGTPRTGTIIALEITETYRLDSSEFQACLKPYPHLRRRLENSYLKRHNTAASASSKHD